ncbi:type II toxin-antitoxin system RelE/ParE family toxin [Brevibacillus sp. SYP-B805]|uniref:type II toxin-antitoxin system RelE/ParE family toxin n=1 Tax=Brevibacillus sp. SYP-B805 TaxID=1578199 RepID=UPI0013ED3242|nr:type II toxin-antitoxin system RelE/ParE family toxin [Brevibacillus sp. SYP-B805]NGQ96118.1 type II toxin-antitoxin system RelE/ParE family toxin [Brevibacillus sp. SYP-B805]
MSNNLEIKYLPVAMKDLEEILSYIERDNPPAAMALLDNLDSTISKLAQFPYMGKIPKDNYLLQKEYRILVVENYLVFYVIMEDIIEIRRILHGKRKYDFLLR